MVRRTGVEDMAQKKKMIKYGLPAFIVLLGILGMKLLLSLNEAPPKEVPVKKGALVDVISVTSGKHTVIVSATGTVVPRYEASIAPQVDGKIVYVSPRFVAGGFFRKGELLFKIESTDYELRLAKARAGVAKAALDLATVEGQAKIARDEWMRLAKGEKGEPNPLVLYGPQLENAKASLMAARAELRQAEIDLERTKVTAPFNCFIRSENIDPGEYVRSGQEVGSVVGTDQVEIVAPVPIKDLMWLDLHDSAETGKGPRAVVRLDVSGKEFAWQGRVERSLGEADPLGRMVRLVVVVDDPYQLETRKEERPDLEIGLFVDVDIEGKTLKDIFLVPRSVLRDDSTVWIASDDNRLVVRPVNVLRKERDFILVDKGLHDGDRVILTNITGVAPGMLLRPVLREQ